MESGRCFLLLGIFVLFGLFSSYFIPIGSKWPIYFCQFFFLYLCLKIILVFKKSSFQNVPIYFYCLYNLNSKQICKGSCYICSQNIASSEKLFFNIIILITERLL